MHLIQSSVICREFEVELMRSRSLGDSDVFVVKLCKSLTILGSVVKESSLSFVTVAHLHKPLESHDLLSEQSLTRLLRVFSRFSITLPF